MPEIIFKTYCRKLNFLLKKRKNSIFTLNHLNKFILQITRKLPLKLKIFIYKEILINNY